jgi:3-hydroxyisobutyrate dehydrogenase-like beta-hydroxyacid dehydrogenase
MQERIGFIGLGTMDTPMSRNVMKKGYELTLYDIVPERMDPIVQGGAVLLHLVKRSQSDRMLSLLCCRDLKK